MSLIITLLVLALVLLSVEFFIPGGIVGMVGALLMLAAVGLTYNDYGIAAAGWVLAGCLVAGALWAGAMLLLMKKTRYGKKMFLEAASAGRASYGVNDEAEEAQADALIGESAVTLTPMSPTGRIELHGRAYEAASQSGFLERGAKVVIIGRSSFGFVVRKH